VVSNERPVRAEVLRRFGNEEGFERASRDALAGVLKESGSLKTK
jgi:hypothetical protein